MGPLKKHHFKLITLFVCLGLFSDFMLMAKNFSPTGTPEACLNNQELKMAALQILEMHCNTCHLNENPKKVFTIDNMEGFAKRINRPVFVFKRMPKGRKRREKISAEEFQVLKNWLTSNLNNN